MTGTQREAAGTYLRDLQQPAWFAWAMTAVFGLAMIAPVAGMLIIPAALVSSFENRRVEPPPVLLPTIESARTYPARFERFFGDNFGFRTILTWLDHWTRAVLLRTSPVSKVMIGREGWLYFLGEDSRSLDRNYRGLETISDSDIAALSMELLRRRDYLETRGIGYIVTVAPEKFSIYPEYLPPWVTRAPLTRFDRVAHALASIPGLNFIDLRPALTAAKARERVYYMTDSHWNYLGATVAYLTLMREVQRVAPGAPTVPPAKPPFVAGTDYYSGDLAAMLALPRSFREDDVAPLRKVLANPGSRCARPETDDLNAPFQTYVYRCPNPPPRTAVVYRDSMAIPLIPLLSENFARITYVSGRKLDRSLVERLHPDIVIEELVERALDAWAENPM